jgi:eukaryotic translation initiation factor 2C
VQAVKSNMYDDDPILSSCGIEIEKQLTRVDARVLSAPTVSLFCLFFHYHTFKYESCFLIVWIGYAIQLVVGNSEDCIPNRGRWNYNNKVVTKLLAREHIYLRTFTLNFTLFFHYCRGYWTPSRLSAGPLLISLLVVT